MKELPTWLRVALLATAVMNVAAAPAFLPAGESLRVRLGFPPGGEPFYLVLSGLFVLLFGLGYLWSGVTGRADRTFLLVAGVGKCAFFLLLAGFWLAGALPSRAPRQCTPTSSWCRCAGGATPGTSTERNRLPKAWWTGSTRSPNCSRRRGPWASRSTRS